MIVTIIQQVFGPNPDDYTIKVYEEQFTKEHIEAWADTFGMEYTISDTSNMFQGCGVTFTKKGSLPSIYSIICRMTVKQ